MHSSVTTHLELLRHPFFSFPISSSFDTHCSRFCLDLMPVSEESLFYDCWWPPVTFYKDVLKIPTFRQAPEFTKVPPFTGEHFTLNTNSTRILDCSFIDLTGKTRYQTTTDSDRTSLRSDSEEIASVKDERPNIYQVTSKNCTEKGRKLLLWRCPGYEPLFPHPEFLNLTFG